MIIRHQRGFSLLELALGLFILGFLFALMPMMISNLSRLQSADPAADPLDSGQQALIGFIIQHDRLPCPDQNNDGQEDCNGGKSGGFPYRTVKLGRPLVNQAGFALHYGVYQHSQVSLSQRQNHFQPSLLGTSNPTIMNGLDFCQGLRLGLSAGLQSTEVSIKNSLGGSGVNPAFMLVDPGTIDTDRDGRLFDGSNATGLVFEYSGRGQDEGYDDRIRAVGFNELSARLRCPELLARVSAATREANAAYDMAQSYTFYHKFREFGVRVREGALDIANTKLDLAKASLVITGAMVASDTASTLTDPGGAAAVAVYFANTIITVIMIEDQISGALEDVADKKEELKTAETQLTAAQTAKQGARNYHDGALADALKSDAKGWFQ